MNSNTTRDNTVNYSYESYQSNNQSVIEITLNHSRIFSDLSILLRLPAAVSMYGGVKRPHPTIHSRHVYKTTVTPTIHTVTSTKHPSRLQFTPSHLQFAPSRLQNNRHVYNSHRHAYKTAVTSTINFKN